MFTRGSKGNGSDNLPVPQPQRRLGKAAPSIISTDLVVVGTLTSTGDVQIDGRVDGDIRSGSVTIGEKANFEGEIVAEEVTVRGRVQGTIRARKVSLAGTCHVEGTILHEALAVEVGAFFEGNCRHSADPLSEVINKPEPQRPAFEPKRDLGVGTSQQASNVIQKPGKIGGNLLGAIKPAQ
ncbi:MAG: polymer-forming cytoskeletal protein [Alphaproteobacteria bacterium]|nr:polymer-forming cytoskeletal protein [Alphaproteobacteria bacterium]